MNDARSITMREEGCSLKPYICPAGFRTIGWGRNMEANPLPPDMQLYLDINGSITEGMAFALLDEDCARARREAESFQWFYLLTDNRQTVIVCMVFQMGLGGVQAFHKMCKALEIGDIDEAARQMMESKWAKHDSPDRAKRLRKMMIDG